MTVVSPSKAGGVQGEPSDAGPVTARKDDAPLLFKQPLPT